MTRDIYSDYFSERKRKAVVFQMIAELQLITWEEEARNNQLSGNHLNPGLHDTLRRRISLLDSANDSLSAVYPSIFGGEPF
jgi:hypothetical protein